MNMASIDLCMTLIKIPAMCSQFKKNNLIISEYQFVGVLVIKSDIKQK